jgi:hypothetical protein
MVLFVRHGDLGTRGLGTLGLGSLGLGTLGLGALGTLGLGLGALGLADLGTLGLAVLGTLGLWALVSCDSFLVVRICFGTTTTSSHKTGTFLLCFLHLPVSI